MASGGYGGYGQSPYKSATGIQNPVYTAPVPVPGISSKQWGGTIGKPPNGLNYPYGGPGTPPDNGNLPPWLSGADGGPGIPPNNGNLPPGLSGVDGGYGGLKSGIQPYTPPASFNPAPGYSQVMADHAAEMGAAGFGPAPPGQPIGGSRGPAEAATLPPPGKTPYTLTNNGGFSYSGPIDQSFMNIRRNDGFTGVRPHNGVNWQWINGNPMQVTEGSPEADWAAMTNRWNVGASSIGLNPFVQKPNYW